MAYCVHCGVELDASLKRCPLCDTPVLDPHGLSHEEAVSPYPLERGKVDEPVQRKDIAIFFSTFLLTVSITCGLLNLFVFSNNRWALMVFGTCMLIWVFFFPILIYKRTSAYISFILDGLAIIVYLFLMANLMDRYQWFYQLGVPIVVLCTLLLELSIILYQKVNRSFLSVGLYLLIDSSLLCMGIELLCRRFLGKPYQLTWSAVVLTVCVILSIMILTVFFSPRLRGAARKRLHF